MEDPDRKFGLHVHARDTHGDLFQARALHVLQWSSCAVTLGEK